MLQNTPKPNRASQTEVEGSGCGETLTVFIIFFLLGLGLSFWGWRIVQDAQASASWPRVQGVVVRSEVTHSTGGEGGDSYSPEVTYKYHVANRDHESYTIKFGENSYSSRRQANEIAAHYPVGRQVTVYYDPAQPGKSVLEPGVTSGSYIVLGIGVLFVVISLVIPPFALYLRRQSG